MEIHLQAAAGIRMIRLKLQMLTHPIIFNNDFINIIYH